MISRNKLGIVFGSLLGLWHLVWAVLVMTGVAQWLMDWVFRLHFIQPPYVVSAFKPIYAIGLIVITSSLGYIFGWIGGAIWNWVHDSPQDDRQDSRKARFFDPASQKG
ncbi:MAG TPA: hypothetical protein VFD63_04440 [Pyrinomonadaceae bacterium]|jgi:hypothetical protein|nr:hypothetical protein [Pyrinomonadaceae bacterium]